jgi:hypothetical protein
MEPGDKPEISEAWWTSNKPEDFQGGKELTRALAEAEGALKNAKKGNTKSLALAVKECNQLRGTVLKTIRKECDKKKDKDLVSVLEKYTPVINDQLKQLYKDGAPRPEDLEALVSGATRQAR